MEVSSADKIESSFKEAVKARSAALAVTQSAFFNSNQKQIVELATKYRLPAIYHRGDFVANGGLMSYGADRAEPFRRAAVYVDKILKGTKPADLPVEQPMKFEFIINLKTAKQIGLTVPPDVLARANRVHSMKTGKAPGISNGRTGNEKDLLGYLYALRFAFSA